MKKNVSIRVHGLVQGVGFRWSTLRIAKRLGITGTVKNNIDGTVSIIAEGDEYSVNDFTKKIISGPNDFAKVKKYEITENKEIKNYSNFSVIS